VTYEEAIACGCPYYDGPECSKHPNFGGRHCTSSKDCQGCTQGDDDFRVYDLGPPDADLFDEGLSWRSVRRKIRLEEDEKFRVRYSLRRELRQALLCKDDDRVFESIGCTCGFLRQHLAGQFLSGMTWENWGRGGWHVDHIVPLNRHDLTNPAHAELANNYTNLRPLWAEEHNARPKDGSDLLEARP
jgi:hypothetical protein